jgi:asparagine synthase (glutamine-hydrolysing)
MKHRVPDGWYHMSGFCGSTNDSQRTRVAAMNAAMAARGAADDRTYTDFFSGVSLGARPLSSVDVEGGKQPLTNEDGTVWAALHGEVYNHRALRTKLSGGDHDFASSMTTEVLVHLYEEYGPTMVRMLEGTYAFALWDARRQELLLVRDRFGEKPLFYSRQAGDILFASELGALLAGMNQEPELDRRSVDAFLVYGYVPEPASIIRGVKQLAPGHLLRWDRRSRRIQMERHSSPVTASGGNSDVASTATRLLRWSRRIGPAPDTEAAPSGRAWPSGSHWTEPGPAS